MDGRQIWGAQVRYIPGKDSVQNRSWGNGLKTGHIVPSESGSSLPCHPVLGTAKNKVVPKHGRTKSLSDPDAGMRDPRVT